MNQLANCPTCNALFVKSEWQTVCPACLKEEEQQFELFYDFLRHQKNRQATLYQVAEATGTGEDLILKNLSDKNGFSWRNSLILATLANGAKRSFGSSAFVQNAGGNRKAASSFECMFK
jgi:hypothetical protein